MNMRRLLLALLLLPLLAEAAPVVRVVELKHRSAEEIAAIIRPLADKESAVSGANGQIVLRGEEAMVKQLVAAIEKLDIAQKALVITVRQGGTTSRSQQGASAQGDPSQPEVRLYSTHDRDNPASTQQIQTVEGQWARISLGTAFPVVQQSTTTTPQGSYTQQSTQYKEVNNGFEVLPRVSGNSVTLDIRAFRGAMSRQGGGIIEQSQVQSTLQGALGQWIDVGGNVDEIQRDENGTVYTTRSRERQVGHIQLKVELAP